MARAAQCKKFHAGETLLAAGEREFRFFVIKKGAVAIVDPASEKKEPVTVLGPGQFTGDIELLAGRPSAVSAIAQSDCEVYEVSADDLKCVLSDLPRIGDTLLRAFLMRRQLIDEFCLGAIRVIASRYSRDTHRICEFLAKNKIPFNWLDLESDPQVEALLARFKVTADQTPVVVCGNDKILRTPSNAELADCLGIQKPIEQTIYDLVIIGAGPAGLAAAVYGASEGLKTLLLDRVGPGGQAGTSSKIENYMGFPEGLSGIDLADRAVIQAEKFGAILSIPAEVVGLESESGYHKLHINSSEEVLTKCVLIASGAYYRRLNIPNFDKFEGAGVYHAATVVEAPLCLQAQVVVVGGGNSAGQAAVFLSEQASKVLLVIRGDELGKSMSYYLVRRIEQTPNIEVHRNTEVTGLHGDKSLAAVDLTNNKTRETKTIGCPAVFVFIGAVPHTTWVPHTIRLDDKGFVETGQQVAESGAWSLQRRPFMLETSVPGIFAAGDVRLGSIKRVASAVGEGSMAVQFVHQFLAGDQKEMTGQKLERGDHKTEISTYENHKHQYSEVPVR
ncbi:MAG TPA: FAD-dependent oxidoreductase [Verrucomicrobiae bacterium]|nr:FAD-dependent oxidoreductase [Verrucomicrobiae bacterium]